MHSASMDIKEFNSDEDAKKAGYNIPLTRAEAGMLSELNRAQRRQWAKRKGYFPPEEHNRWQANKSEAKRREKRVRKATLTMQKRARALR